MGRSGRCAVCLVTTMVLLGACGSAVTSSESPSPTPSPTEAVSEAVPVPRVPPPVLDGAADTEPDTEPVTPSDTEPATTPSTTTAPTAPPTTPPGDPAGASVSLVEVASFEQPLDMSWAADGTGPFVAEKTGRLHRLDPGSGDRTLILDLSDRVSTNSERGLLGTAFSPDGAWLYASFTDGEGTSIIEAWPWAGVALDPDAGTEIIRVAQPFANHNGGDVEFGPDGLLYWALGDGGSADDPLGSGQDLSTLLGSLLRIDPRPESGGYDIPADNPFVGVDGARPEIWHFGLRNPWKISFDPATGDLWIGDVGQNAVEEIDRAPAGVGGLNFGWNCREGNTDFSGCVAVDAVEPALVYGRSSGESVTGGHVYRGSAIPELSGAYVFGDFSSGRIWALGQGQAAATDLGITVPALAAFGQSPDGEVWTVSLVGPVSRLVS